MKKKAFRAALPYSLPICIGFLFIAIGAGFIYRREWINLSNT